jgi:tRNA(Ile)-lysidine synthase
LVAAAPEALRRFVSAACLCAAGTDRPPAAGRVRRLADALAGNGPLTASLAGARIEADDRGVRFLREAGEAARGGLSPLRLAAGETGVWDGRFEISAERAIEVRRLAGHASRLSRGEKAALNGFAAAVRPGLPLVVGGGGEIACPVLTAVTGVRVAPLGFERLQAACGAIDRETA